MKQSHHEEFVARAKEAEEAAAKSQDPEQKEDWKKIAEIYRDLASKLV